MTKIAVIVNKKAKNAESITGYLDALKEKQIDYSDFLVEPNDLEKTIQACTEKYPLILVGGGDGTIRTAAQWCANKDITLGVLPLGTMNHFAKELKLPLTVDELVEALKKPKRIKIDLAEVNGVVFINNSSIGFYPKLAKKRDYYAKQYPKWLSYIPSFLEALSYHDVFSINLQNEALNRRLYTSFFMISNNMYSYQFPVTVGRENFNQKILGIYFLKHGKLRISKIFSHLLRKTNHFEIIESETTIKVDIKGMKKIPISLDGDAMTMDTPLIYRCLPDALQLLTK